MHPSGCVHVAGAKVQQIILRANRHSRIMTDHKHSASVWVRLAKVAASEFQN